MISVKYCRRVRVYLNLQKNSSHATNVCLQLLRYCCVLHPDIGDDDDDDDDGIVAN